MLVGNRLHLAFNRKVGQRDAETYANKHNMAFFEVSPLCNFNIHESFCELSRMALQRNGLERLWRSNKGKQIAGCNRVSLNKRFQFQYWACRSCAAGRSWPERRCTVSSSCHCRLSWSGIWSRTRWRHHPHRHYATRTVWRRREEAAVSFRSGARPPRLLPSRTDAAAACPAILARFRDGCALNLNGIGKLSSLFQKFSTWV